MAAELLSRASTLDQQLEREIKRVDESMSILNVRLKEALSSVEAAAEEAERRLKSLAAEQIENLKSLHHNKLSMLVEKLNELRTSKCVLTTRSAECRLISESESCSSRTKANSLWELEYFMKQLDLESTQDLIGSMFQLSYDRSESAFRSLGRIQGGYLTLKHVIIATDPSDILRPDKDGWVPFVLTLATVDFMKRYFALRHVRWYDCVMSEARKYLRIRVTDPKSNDTEVRVWYEPNASNPAQVNVVARFLHSRDGVYAIRVFLNEDLLGDAPLHVAVVAECSQEAATPRRSASVSSSSATREAFRDSATKAIFSHLGLKNSSVKNVETQTDSLLLTRSRSKSVSSNSFDSNSREAFRDKARKAIVSHLEIKSSTFNNAATQTNRILLGLSADEDLSDICTSQLEGISNKEIEVTTQQTPEYDKFSAKDNDGSTSSTSLSSLATETPNMGKNFSQDINHSIASENRSALSEKPNSLSLHLKSAGNIIVATGGGSSPRDSENRSSFSEKTISSSLHLKSAGSIIVATGGGSSPLWSSSSSNFRELVDVSGSDVSTKPPFPCDIEKPALGPNNDVASSTICISLEKVPADVKTHTDEESQDFPVSDKVFGSDESNSFFKPTCLPEVENKYSSSFSTQDAPRNGASDDPIKLAGVNFSLESSTSDSSQMTVVSALENVSSENSINSNVTFLSCHSSSEDFLKTSEEQKVDSRIESLCDREPLKDLNDNNIEEVLHHKSNTQSPGKDIIQKVATRYGPRPFSGSLRSEKISCSPFVIEKLSQNEIESKSPKRMRRPSALSLKSPTVSTTDENARPNVWPANAPEFILAPNTFTMSDQQVKEEKNYFVKPEVDSCSSSARELSADSVADIFEGIEQKFDVKVKALDVCDNPVENGNDVVEDCNNDEKVSVSSLKHNDDVLENFGYPLEKQNDSREHNNVPIEEPGEIKIVSHEQEAFQLKNNPSQTQRLMIGAYRNNPCVNPYVLPIYNYATFCSMLGVTASPMQIERAPLRPPPGFEATRPLVMPYSQSCSPQFSPFALQSQPGTVKIEAQSTSLTHHNPSLQTSVNFEPTYKAPILRPPPGLSGLSNLFLKKKEAINKSNSSIASSENQQPSDPNVEELTPVSPLSSANLSVDFQPSCHSSRLSAKNNLEAATPLSLTRSRDSVIDNSVVVETLSDLSLSVPELPEKDLDLARLLSKNEKKLSLKLDRSWKNCYFPLGVTVDPRTKKIYVCDNGNDRVKIFSNDGDVLETFGKRAKNHKVRMPGEFIRPSAVVVVTNEDDPKIYVKDMFCIQVFDDHGKFIFAFGHEVLKEPYGLALNRYNHLVTIDGVRDEVFIVIFDLKGELKHRRRLEIFPAGTSDSLIRVSKCRFLGIFECRVYVVNLGLDVVHVCDFDGKLLTQFGAKGGDEGCFRQAAGVTFDSAGNCVVADAKNNRLQVFDPKGNFLGFLVTTKPLNRPSDIHLTSDGELLVSNFMGHCVDRFVFPE